MDIRSMMMSTSKTFTSRDQTALILFILLHKHVPPQGSLRVRLCRFLGIQFEGKSYAEITHRSNHPTSGETTHPIRNNSAQNLVRGKG